MIASFFAASSCLTEYVATVTNFSEKFSLNAWQQSVIVN